MAMRGLRSSKASVDGVGGGEVGVAEVEGDAYVGEVAGGEDFEEVFGGGDFVLEIFEEDLYAEGMGEGFEVLDGGEGVFEGAEVPGIVLEAEVEGEGGEGDLLGGLEGALDLVHGVMRWDFSGSMRLMFGATWRDHWPVPRSLSRWADGGWRLRRCRGTRQRCRGQRSDRCNRSGDGRRRSR